MKSDLGRTFRSHLATRDARHATREETRGRDEIALQRGSENRSPTKGR